ncbi:MAG TPA: hypothetical protein VFZ65_07770 [Planctomycetota bacterium]|nr:hypothetical protein [Planctomycetota bacterium]
MNSSNNWLGVGAVLLPAVAVVAQEDVFEQLPLRVSSLRPDGSLVVDRGRRDLVEVGDRVVLSPRNGPVVQGAVVEVDDRTALVEIVDRTAVLPIGTKGHVLLPRTRTAQRPAEVTEPTETPPPPPADEEWRPGMPLLGHTRPPRPNERPRAAVNGRTYTSANLVRTLDSWTHSFLISGMDVEVANPNGDGGVLRFHGEFDWMTETSERTGTDIRLYDVSYEHGGTRFEPVHWQIGRFLPRDMPEFGLLDGAQIGLRREGGDRIGCSVGYLPELDEDLESLADLQVAAWYIWTSGVGERVTWGIGYQKSWHRLEADRDLVVVKTRFLPLDDWDLSATVWIDFYGGNDNLKNDPFEISRANAFVTRRWKGSGGLEFAYDHESYPDLLRRELPQTIQPATLATAHQDRLSAYAYTLSAENTRWYTRLTGWTDEQDDGFTGEFGVEAPGLLQKGARTGIAVYDVQGLGKSVAGVRLDHGGEFSYGRLDLLYELGYVHQDGFPSNRDDLLQHRLGILVGPDLGASWACSIYADGTLYDKELSFGLGIYLQRHF